MLLATQQTITKDITNMQRHLTMTFANFVISQKIQYILMHVHLRFGENTDETCSTHHYIKYSKLLCLMEIYNFLFVDYNQTGWTPSEQLNIKVNLTHLNIQSVPRSKHSVSVIQTSQLILRTKIIAVCSQFQTKHITYFLLCGLNVAVGDVRPRCTSSSQSDLKG